MSPLVSLKNHAKEDLSVPDAYGKSPDSPRQALEYQRTMKRVLIFFALTQTNWAPVITLASNVPLEVWMMAMSSSVVPFLK
jgi:hypothetical protein